jgi:UDP-2-acetamido-2-deoxy-ribo-hexuluronate aminotransferase
VDKRDDVAERLKKDGVPTAVHYPVPLHLQPAFADLGLAEGSMPVSERIARRVLSLPMHPYLASDVQDRIVTCLNAALGATVSLAN